MKISIARNFVLICATDCGKRGKYGHVKSTTCLFATATRIQLVNTMRFRVESWFFPFFFDFRRAMDVFYTKALFSTTFSLTSTGTMQQITQ
jgi:hypothetical protein